MHEILDQKTELLVAIGAAAAAKCQTCFKTLYGKRDAVGVSDKEVRAAVAIGAKVAAKSQQFMAQFIDDTTSGAAGSAAGLQDAAGGCGCQ